MLITATLLLVIEDQSLVKCLRNAELGIGSFRDIAPARQLKPLIYAGWSAFLGMDTVHGGPSSRALMDIESTTTTRAGFSLCEGFEKGLRMFVYCDGTECQTREEGKSGIYLKDSMDSETYNRVLGAIDPKNCSEHSLKRKRDRCEICD